MVLGAVTARRRLEEQACTVGGALGLIDDLNATSAAGAAEDETAAMSEADVIWVTVPDLGMILEAAVIRADAAAEREMADNRDRLHRLRPQLPVAGTRYPVPEFTDRFQALCESVVLCGQLGLLEEAQELAQFGASLVLVEDPTAAPPWILDMGGDICWAIAVTNGDGQWYHQAINRYLAACGALRASGFPAVSRRDHALTLVNRCLELYGSGLPPRRKLIDTARQCLAEIDPGYAHHPDVVRARYAVARTDADRAELATIAAPSFPGHDALTAADLRIAQTLSDLFDHADWQRAFGPFGAPLYAWCMDVPQADAFTAFGLLGADEALPPAGTGFHAARIGHVTLAESNCDQVGATVRLWMQLAERSDSESSGYMIDGTLKKVGRAVPAAGMSSLARFIRRHPDEVPESVKFLFQLGREHAGDALFGQQADRMLAFFEDLGESETSEICGAILLGAASATLPAARLGTYITMLATGSGHDAALALAGHGTPITAWIPADDPLPSTTKGEA
jgi:hypothetical protein